MKTTFKPHESKLTNSIATALNMHVDSMATVVRVTGNGSFSLSLLTHYPPGDVVGILASANRFGTCTSMYDLRPSKCSFGYVCSVRSLLEGGEEKVSSQ